MPYVICTNMPGCLPERDPVAVATLAEAREYAGEEVVQASYRADFTEAVWSDCEQGCYDIPAHGCVIGPMPDGYVIDVQFVTWLTLRGLIDLAPGEAYVHGDMHATRQNVIDAYNGG